jgi:hypothetical protein
MDIRLMRELAEACLAKPALNESSSSSVRLRMLSLLGEAADFETELQTLDPKHHEHLRRLMQRAEKGAFTQADVKKQYAKSKRKGDSDTMKGLELLQKHGNFLKADVPKIPAKGALTVKQTLDLLSQHLDSEAKKSPNPYAADHFKKAHDSIATAMASKMNSTNEKDMDELEGRIRSTFTPNFSPANKILKRMGRPEHSEKSFSSLIGKAVTKQPLTPDQYRQLHGECPDGYHFDSTVKRCVKM